MFGGSTEEYESLEAGRRIKYEKDQKDAFRNLMDLILHDADRSIIGHRVSAILSEYPHLRKQRVINETVYCKWTGENHPTGNEHYYLGTSPEGKCPVCGHKGKHHDHAHKQSSCRICTAEQKERKKHGRKEPKDKMRQ